MGSSYIRLYQRLSHFGGRGAPWNPELWNSIHLFCHFFEGLHDKVFDEILDKIIFLKKYLESFISKLFLRFFWQFVCWFVFKAVVKLGSCYLGSCLDEVFVQNKLPPSLPLWNEVVYGWPYRIWVRNGGPATSIEYFLHFRQFGVSSARPKIVAETFLKSHFIFFHPRGFQFYSLYRQFSFNTAFLGQRKPVLKENRAVGGVF